jgi:hypothetical protein
VPFRRLLFVTAQGLIDFRERAAPAGHAARRDEMSVNDANGVRHVTRAEWNALREHFKRVRAENAQVCGAARQTVADAVECRLRLEDARLDRDNAQ